MSVGRSAHNDWGFSVVCRKLGTSPTIRAAISNAGRLSHHSSFVDKQSEVRGEGRAGNKFHFIVEMEICVMALKIWFYVCV